MSLTIDNITITGISLVAQALYADPSSGTMVELSAPSIKTGEDSYISLADDELAYGAYIYDTVAFYNIVPLTFTEGDTGVYNIVISSAPGTEIKCSTQGYELEMEGGTPNISIAALNNSVVETFIIDNSGYVEKKNVSAANTGPLIYWTIVPFTAIASNALIEVTYNIDPVLSGNYFAYDVVDITTLGSQDCPACGGDVDIISCEECGGSGSIPISSGSFSVGLSCTSNVQTIQISLWDEPTLPSPITQTVINDLMSARPNSRVYYGPDVAQSINNTGTLSISNGRYVVAWGFSESADPVIELNLSMNTGGESGDGTGSGDSTENPCLTGDTLITMADGSYKRLDEITIGEQVKTEHGISNVYYISNTAIHPNHVIYEFDDGTIVKEVNEHAFFNVESQYYKVLKSWDIGDHAINEKGELVQLIRKELVEEDTRQYGLWTEQGTYYANGLLTSCIWQNKDLLKDMDVDAVMDVILSVDQTLMKNMLWT